jgi:hypothetical protein
VPALSLPLLSASVGFLLSWSARSNRSAPQGRATWLVVFYALLVHAPVLTTILALNPDWSFAYLVGPGRRQIALVLACSLVIAGALPLAFLLGSRLGQSGRLGALGWMAVLVASSAANTLAFLPRVQRDASYVEFQNDFGGQSLSGSALGYTLIWALLTLGGVLFFTHSALRKLAHEQESLPTLLDSHE